MNRKVQIQIQPDWWVKSILGTVLSLLLAVGLANLMIVLFKPFMALDVLAQMGMWSIAILFLALLFGCFYFKTGWHMVGVMSVMNFLSYALIFALRGLI